MMGGSGSVLTDPYPGGTKTYGSYGSGSGSGTLLFSAETPSLGWGGGSLVSSRDVARPLSAEDEPIC
jgi:hypothetical protein